MIWQTMRTKTVFGVSLFLYWNFLTQLLLVSCSEPVSDADQIGENWIIWSSDYKLQWADFEGTRNGTETFAAYTNSGLQMDYDINSGAIDITVKALFVKDSSYVVMDFADQNVLAHEQGHFDLSEVFARRLKEQVSELEVSQDSLKRVSYSAPDSYRGVLA